MKLRNIRSFLPSFVLFHQNNEADVRLAWVAPSNMKRYYGTEASWVFHMDVDWDPRYDIEPSDGMCSVSMFGLSWSITGPEGGIQSAETVCIPPQLEILDRLAKGGLRRLLFSEWTKVCQSEKIRTRYKTVFESLTGLDSVMGKNQVEN